MWIVYGFIVFCAVRLAVFLNARLKRAAAANITYGDMRFRVLSRVFLYPVRQLAWQGLFFDNTDSGTLQVAYVIVWFPTSVARAESLLNPEMKGIDVVTLNSAATLCLQLAGFINFGIFLYVDCACRLPHTRLCALHTRPCVTSCAQLLQRLQVALVPARGRQGTAWWRHGEWCWVQITGRGTSRFHRGSRCQGCQPWRCALLQRQYRG